MSDTVSSDTLDILVEVAKRTNSRNEQARKCYGCLLLQRELIYIKRKNSPVRKQCS